MTTEIKDQTKRTATIALLQLSIEKNDAAIRATSLTLTLQMDKQVHRLAELRFQKMLLKQAADKAAFLQQSSQQSLKPSTL